MNTFIAFCWLPFIILGLVEYLWVRLTVMVVVMVMVVMMIGARWLHYEESIIIIIMIGEWWYFM
jgi:hypothetical protein